MYLLLTDGRLVSIPFGAGMSFSSATLKPVSQPLGNDISYVTSSGNLFAFHRNLDDAIATQVYNPSNDSWSMLQLSQQVQFLNQSIYFSPLNTDMIHIYGGKDLNNEVYDRNLIVNITNGEISLINVDTSKPTPFYGASQCPISESSTLIIGGKAKTAWVSMGRVAIWEFGGWSFKPILNPPDPLTITSNTDDNNIENDFWIDSRIDFSLMPIITSLQIDSNNQILLESNSALIIGGTVGNRNSKPNIIKLLFNNTISNSNNHNWQWDSSSSSLNLIFQSDNNNNNNILGAVSIYETLITISKPSISISKLSRFLKRSNDYSISMYNVNTWEKVTKVITSQNSNTIIHNHNNSHSSLSKSIIIIISTILPILFIIIIIIVLIYIYYKKKSKNQNLYTINQFQLQPQMPDLYSSKSTLTNVNNNLYNYFSNDRNSINSWKLKRLEYDNQAIASSGNNHNENSKKQYNNNNNNKNNNNNNLSRRVVSSTPFLSINKSINNEIEVEVPQNLQLHSQNINQNVRIFSDSFYNTNTNNNNNYDFDVISTASDVHKTINTTTTTTNNNEFEEELDFSNRITIQRSNQSIRDRVSKKASAPYKSTKRVYSFVSQQLGSNSIKLRKNSMIIPTSSSNYQYNMHMDMHDNNNMRNNIRLSKDTVVENINENDNDWFQEGINHPFEPLNSRKLNDPLQPINKINNYHSDNDDDDNNIFKDRDVQVLVSSKRRSKLRVMNPDNDISRDNSMNSLIHYNL